MTGGYLNGLSRAERRAFREALSANASASAQEWAENSQDAFRGHFIPVEDQGAIEALRLVYEVVLRRGGLDHVAQICPKAALAFPSQAAFERPSPVLGWFANYLVTGDCQIGIEQYARERQQLSAWLAAGIDGEGGCRFSVLVRAGVPGPAFQRKGREDALRKLAFDTLSAMEQAAIRNGDKYPFLRDYL